CILRRKAIDRDLLTDDANLERVALSPLFVECVSIRQEVNALIGGTDPAALGIRVVAVVRTIDENVGETEQLRHLGFRAGAQLLARVPTEDHHRQTEFPSTPC